MKVYITKYALTKGIIEKEVEPNTSISDKMVTEIKNGHRNSYHKPFWYESKEEAIAHAEILRKAKLNSLKKSISKIEKLDFKITYLPF